VDDPAVGDVGEGDRTGHEHDRENDGGGHPEDVPPRRGVP
jgi:hypothetical protein